MLAGCGGDGGDGGNGGALTSDELAAQANAICADTEEQIDAIEAPQTLEQLADSTEQVQEIFDAGLADLRELEPPADLQADFDEFISVNEEQSARLGEVVEAARANDEERVAQIAEEGEQAETRSDELARAFGAEECADD